MGDHLGAFEELSVTVDGILCEDLQESSYGGKQAIWATIPIGVASQSAEVAVLAESRGLQSKPAFFTVLPSGLPRENTTTVCVDAEGGVVDEVGSFIIEETIQLEVNPGYESSGINDSGISRENLGGVLGNPDSGVSGVSNLEHLQVGVGSHPNPDPDPDPISNSNPNPDPDPNPNPNPNPGVYLSGWRQVMDL